MLFVVVSPGGRDVHRHATFQRAVVQDLRRRGVTRSTHVQLVVVGVQEG
jgi:hypothetical protein